ncbi:hypothetical protein F5X71_10965 [Nocardia brasiliensis]|uniref:Uncharacterized protein n=2 Tax=Nocardia brasiliensis TaxID=37326 RepID=A0A6G9Y2G9_NOCBR|nr:hypothetical protein F5X71_10965 [Nocardia brasiliensis]
MPLNPVEQHERLSEITARIVETMPAGWTRAVIRGLVVGGHTESRSGVKMPDGSVQGWSFRPEIWRMFMDLRAGMYVPGTGTWVGFEYVLDPPGRFKIQFTRDEDPKFETAPSSADFALENRRYPRSADTMSDWFRAGLGAD